MYENLTAVLFVERLHRQSGCLARETVDVDGSQVTLVKGGGGQVEHQEKDRPRTPYWQGQQS